MFKVQGLSKSVRSKNILKNVSFEVAHGKIAIFLGGSGVGKTTLLRVINGLETADGGKYSLDEKQLDQPLKCHGHLIGMVFQHFNLFEHLTVEENITIALMKNKGATKKEALAIAGVLLERYELKEKSKESTAMLSGGQKQRLAIARTLALDPKIVCLDEPTSALDPHLTSKVAGYITELAKEGRIVLLTTHDMKLVDQLEGELFLMEEGAIVERAEKGVFGTVSALSPKLSRYIQS